MARPTKLDEKITATVCDALTAGLSIEGACARAGIAPSSYYDWVKRGTADDAQSPFAEFAEATARARAEVEERLLESVEWAAGERIRQRALGGGEHMMVVDEVERDWRAAAWLLERKFPTSYGQRQTIEHGGRIDSAVDMQLPPGAGDAALEFVKRLGEAADDAAN